MRNNPIDEVLDFWTLSFVKMYFFPFFVIGISDNVVDLFKPQTYSICR